jgi:hypothetical protein
VMGTFATPSKSSPPAGAISSLRVTTCKRTRRQRTLWRSIEPCTSKGTATWSVPELRRQCERIAGPGSRGSSLDGRTLMSSSDSWRRAIINQ